MLDKSMPYYNIVMRRPQGVKIPEKPQLPEGFTFVDYSFSTEENAASFHRAWAEILVEVLEFDNLVEATEYLNTHYLIHQTALAERMFFIKSAEGALVATLTNWWHEFPVYEPSMHWVAVLPSYQGLGLGRALIQEGVRRMVALEGDRDVYLHTQNWSVAAIGLYMDAGYIIEPLAAFANYKNDFVEGIKTLKNMVRTAAAPMRLSRAARLKVPQQNGPQTKEEILKTDRLTIVPFGPEHVLMAVERLNTPTVRAFLGGVKTESEATDAFVRQALGVGASTGLYWAVLDLEGAFLGSVSLDQHHEASALEISYVFAELAWGKGYALEALSRVVDHCRCVYGLEALVAETQRANMPSCKLLERLGFTAARSVQRFGAEQLIYTLNLNDYVHYIRKGFGQGPLNLTGVTVVVHDGMGRVLLQKRHEASELWGLLGGICELGESFEETGIREVFEESGLVLKREDLKLVGTNSGPQTYMHLANGHQAYFMTVVFSALYKGGELIADGEESLKLQFYPLDALPVRVPGTHREMLAMFCEVI